MNRSIIPDAPATPMAPAAQAGSTEVPAPVPVARRPSGGEPRDALAGALPEWDLLPASPFIRRAK